VQIAVQGERFLVTGSDGCIGSWVTACLARLGAPVVAADLSTEGRRVRLLVDDIEQSSITFAAVDVAASNAVAHLIADHGITRVVHLAALQVPFVAARPVVGAEVNIVGTMQVFEAARQAGGQVRGVAYASSSAAHGPEHAPSEPATLYGVFKRGNEQAARFYARDYGTPTIGLRPCVVYGPNRDQGMTAAVTHAIRAAVLGIPYEMPFCGPLDVQFAEDVAWSFIAAAMTQPTDALVFDLHGDVVDVATIVECVTGVVGADPGLLSYAATPLQGGDGYDDSDLISLVGDLPKTAFADGVERTAQVFRDLTQRGLLTAESIPGAAREGSPA
jgi:UDP-glucuronate 4-epimerase